MACDVSPVAMFETKITLNQPQPDLSNKRKIECVSGGAAGSDERTGSRLAANIQLCSESGSKNVQEI